MEIVKFINDGEPLTSPPILTEFVEKYPKQNAGLLGEDIFKFVQEFNKDVSLLYDDNYVCNTNGLLFYVMNGSHMFYVYRNVKDNTIEKWDPSTWQCTTNNCTLYAGLCAIIRPLVSFADMKAILLKITDKKDSDGARLLGIISKHFFNRGEELFRYH